MKYVFEISINTDGDFCLPFVPRGMKFDGDVTYTFEKEYENKINAVEDVKCICQFLKRNMHTSKMHVKEDWDNMLDRFIKSIDNKSKEFEELYVYEFMSGNYDGTDFNFYTKHQPFEFICYLTDEECEIVKKGRIGLLSSDIKQAILDVYKNNIKEV